MMIYISVCSASSRLPWRENDFVSVRPGDAHGLQSGPVAPRPLWFVIGAGATDTCLALLEETPLVIGFFSARSVAPPSHVRQDRWAGFLSLSLNKLWWLWAHLSQLMARCAFPSLVPHLSCTSVVPSLCSVPPSCFCHFLHSPSFLSASPMFPLIIFVLPILRSHFAPHTFSQFLPNLPPSVLPSKFPTLICFAHFPSPPAVIGPPVSFLLLPPSSMLPSQIICSHCPHLSSVWSWQFPFKLHLTRVGSILFQIFSAHFLCLSTTPVSALEFFLPSSVLLSHSSQPPRLSFLTLHSFIQAAITVQ